MESSAPPGEPGLVLPAAAHITPAGDRIWFAQMLRGVAALCVVYFHLGEVFWKDNAYAVKPMFLNPIALGSKPLYLHLTGWMGHNYIELGDYGVALFFLISGFVIPFSLAKVGAVKFLVRRCLRIYPTYIVGLTISTVALLLNAHFSGITFTYTFSDYLVNAALLFDIFPHPRLDGVNWTLIIELRFYLLCVLINGISHLGSSLTLAVCALFLCLSNFLTLNGSAWLSGTLPHTLISMVSGYSPYLIFMLIGICFHNLFQVRWSGAFFGLMTVLLMALFYISASFISGHHWILRLTRGYTLALATFSLIYLFRDRFKPNAVLDFFAEISFPLYVIHCCAGISLLTFFYHLFPFSLLNLLATLLVIIPLAFLLHTYVELPSNRLGHVLTSKKRPSSQPI